MQATQSFLENLPIAWMLISAAAGFWIARKFPGLVPLQVSNNAILDRLEALESKLSTK